MVRSLVLVLLALALGCGPGTGSSDTGSESDSAATSSDVDTATPICEPSTYSMCTLPADCANPILECSRCGDEGYGMLAENGCPRPPCNDDGCSEGYKCVEINAPSGLGCVVSVDGLSCGCGGSLEAGVALLCVPEDCPQPPVG